VAVPGRSADSGIIDRVTNDDPDVRMPAEAPPLSEPEIDALRRWIERGPSLAGRILVSPRSLSTPLKPRRPDLPSAEAGIDNPIDRIVFAYLEKARHRAARAGG